MKERLGHINRLLEVMPSAWPFLLVELENTIRDKTESLISKEDEETRGAIKALRNLLNLPSDLQHEREALTVALSEQDAA